MVLADVLYFLSQGLLEKAVRERGLPPPGRYCDPIFLSLSGSLLTSGFFFIGAAVFFLSPSGWRRLGEYVSLALLSPGFRDAPPGRIGPGVRWAALAIFLPFQPPPPFFLRH